MIKFEKTISDFWSQDLKDFKFSVLSPLTQAQREYWTHPNYNNELNKLEQAFDNDLPDYWPRFMEEMNIKEGTVSWTNIAPGNVVPVHTDKFYKLRKKYNVTEDECIRYLMFLQDWELGQMVEFEEKILTRWKKGDVWSFGIDDSHCAANATQDNFITCQINTFERK